MIRAAVLLSLSVAARAQKLATLQRISMSALDAKDPERAEKWMRACMDAAKDAPGGSAPKRPPPCP
jgi:hypothetical protein